MLVANLLKDPDTWDDQFKRYTYSYIHNPVLNVNEFYRSAASIVLSVVYGWPPIESKGNQVVTRINDHVHRLARAALPGGYLVDTFPVMKLFPSWVAKWKREGLEWHQKDSEMFEGLMDGVREKAVSDIVRLDLWLIRPTEPIGLCHSVEATISRALQHL